MNDQTPFIVLRHTDYQDSDLILGGVSPEGQVSFIGKSLKKTTSRNAHACQLFSESVIQYDQKNSASIHRMKTASLVKGHRALREDLDLQILASVTAETAMKIPDGKDLYEIVKKTFEKLETGEKPFLVFGSFLSDILKREGNQPMADMCVRCGTVKGIVAYSVKEGGFLCGKCAEKNPGTVLDIEQLRNLRILIKGTMEQMDRMPDSLNDPLYAGLLLDTLEYHTGIHLLAAEFFRSWYSEHR